MHAAELPPIRSEVIEGINMPGDTALLLLGFVLAEGWPGGGGPGGGRGPGGRGPVPFMVGALLNGAAPPSDPLLPYKTIQQAFKTSIGS